jgi:hypothetical protein
MRNSILLVVGVVAAATAAFIGLGGDSTAPRPAVTAVAEAPTPAQVPAAEGDVKSVVEGEVLQTIDVAGYTYLRLRTANGEEWAAVPRSTIAKGSRARVEDASLMQQFRSDSLDRTFERIYFGVLSGDQAQVSGHGGAAPPTGSAAAIAVGKVEPLTGEDARNVAQLFAQKAALAGKKIRVRGQVTKVTRGVMGKNWLHLQDGSGSAEAGDNDLVVTTLGDAQIGNIVVVVGVVSVDKDLGAGYRYAVLLEDAEVALEPAPQAP